MIIRHPKKHLDDDLFNTYSCAYNDLASGILIYDAGLNIVFANKQAVCHWGMGHCQNKKQGLLNPALHDEMKPVLNCILNKQMPEEGMEICLTRDGQQAKWALVHGNILCLNQHQYIILSLTDISPYKLKEMRLLRELELDFSTQTLNKYGLLKCMEKHLAVPGQKPFTVCMLDFDDFKVINDSHGHIIGDNVLTTFANITRKHIREHDFVGRYGGEEFVFVFPNTQVKDVAAIITRIKTELERCFRNFSPYQISFSAGAIYVDPKSSPATDSLELINQADKLLYKAKARGKNRIVASDQEYCFI